MLKFTSLIKANILRNDDENNKLCGIDLIGEKKTYWWNHQEEKDGVNADSALSQMNR